MLLVSVPLMVALAWLLTSASSSSLTKAAEDRGGNIARAVTLHVEDWLAERTEHVAVVAAQASGRLGTPQAARLLLDSQKYGDYESVEMLDLNGKVVASSCSRREVLGSRSGLVPDRSVRQAHTDDARYDAAAGSSGFWPQPVLDAKGRPEGVVAANLNLSQLAGLLNPELDSGTRGGGRRRLRHSALRHEDGERER